MAIMSLDPTESGRRRWTNRWKAELNDFDITFDGRLSAGRNQFYKKELHRLLATPCQGLSWPPGQLRGWEFQ